MRNRGRGHYPVAHFASRVLLALAGLTALSLAGCSGSNGQVGLAKVQTFTWPYVNTTAYNNPTARCRRAGSGGHNYPSRSQQY